MNIIQFTRASNGELIYVRAKHISMMRKLETDPSKTIIFVHGETDVITEDLMVAVDRWRGCGP